MTRSSGGLDVACKNGSVILTLGKAAFYNETSRTIKVVAKHKGSDQEAVWYIVVVLLFYSLGIIIAIVTYLKRERAEIEEQKSYEDYFNFKLDPGRHSRYYRVQQVAMQLKIMEEERKKKTRIPLEKDRPRKCSKKRYGRSHSWHFATFSPFASPTRTPTSPQESSMIAHNLRLTLPASLGLPGLPTRQAISLNVTPTNPHPPAPFVSVPPNKNGGIRRTLSLNVSPAHSTEVRLDQCTGPKVAHPDIAIDSPSSAGGGRHTLDSLGSDTSSQANEDTAFIVRCTSPDVRRTLVTNL